MIDRGKKEQGDRKNLVEAGCPSAKTKYILIYQPSDQPYFSSPSPWREIGDLLYYSPCVSLISNAYLVSPLTALAALRVQLFIQFPLQGNKDFG